VTMTLMFSSPLLRHTAARCQRAKASSGVLSPPRAPRVNQTPAKWLPTLTDLAKRLTCNHASIQSHVAFGVLSHATCALYAAPRGVMGVTAPGEALCLIFGERGWAARSFQDVLSSTAT
jgi:hypothetical protein